MGMYTELINKDNLKILNEDELEKRAEELMYLFNYDSVKFYYYWNDEYLKVLNDLGIDGVLEGEIEIYGENRDYLMCKWDKTGFHYKHGEIVYPKEWVKGFNEVQE